MWEFYYANSELESYLKVAETVSLAIQNLLTFFMVMILGTPTLYSVSVLSYNCNQN